MITTYLRFDRKRSRLVFFYHFSQLFPIFVVLSSSHIVFMGNYYYIFWEINEAAFKMSQEGLSDEQIEQFLGIGGQTMRQLRVTYHATRDVVQIQACSGQPAYWMASMCEYVFSHSTLDSITNYCLSFLRAAYCTSRT